MDMIDFLIDAEKNSENVKSDAKELAKKIVFDARAEGRRLLENAEKEAEIKSQLILEGATKESDQEYTDYLSKLAEDMSKLKDSLSEKIDRASDFIVERIEELYGNS